MGAEVSKLPKNRNIEFLGFYLHFTSFQNLVYAIQSVIYDKLSSTLINIAS